MAQSILHTCTTVGGERGLLAAIIYLARRDVAGRGPRIKGSGAPALRQPLAARRFLQTTGRRWLENYFDADDELLERIC